MPQTRTYVVGREPRCDVRLGDDSVSRRHAEVERLRDGRLRVTDCRSTNGTFVSDGADWRTFHQAVLEPTQRVRFGDYDLSVRRLEELCRAADVAGGAGPAVVEAGGSAWPEEDAARPHHDAAHTQESRDLREPLESLAPGTRLREFTIERVLGAGGFGVTYLARDESLGAWRALKEYLPRDWGTRRGDGAIGPRTEADATDYRWGLERFLREARVLARFNHANIVRVYRVFETHGTAYMVTEYVEGRTLADEFEATGPLSGSRVRNLLAALMEGLRVVHEAGVWHRDIKPENVMVRPDGTPVLIDFGAARLAMGRHSHSLPAVLTPGYAPLEQYSARGRQGPWTDIYALGAVAYWALSGARPHDAPERVPEDPLRPLSAVAPRQVGPGLASAVEAALAVHEKDRPQSLDEWRARLEPPAPAPDGPLRRLANGVWLRWVLASTVGWAAAWATTVPVEGLVGFAAGGAALVDGVFGALIGTAQWLVLRERISQAVWWVPASAAGTVLGGLAASIPSWPMDVFGTGVVYGTFVGSLQWAVLRRQVGRAGSWVPAAVAGELASAACANLVPFAPRMTGLGDVSFGVVNGAVQGAVTGLVLAWLLRPPGRAPSERPSA